MKAIVWSMIAVAGLGACGVADPERVSEGAQELVYPNDIFYDNFNSLAEGSINGQNGWAGNCVVANAVATNATSRDKNLECTGMQGLPNGQGAQHSFVRLPNRNYHLQFDVWTRGVSDGTHGKIFLENPPGDGSHTVFQLAVGCDNIRATFEYHGETTRQLLSFPCSNGPHYRVACIWHDGGTQLRCGASVLPNDPVEANFVTIPTLGEPLGPFDRIRVLGGIGERTGTTVFDKVQVLSD